jgi:hypothetical protein
LNGFLLLLSSHAEVLLIQSLTILLKLVNFAILDVFSFQTSIDSGLQFISVSRKGLGAGVLRVKFMLELLALKINLIQLVLTIHNCTTDFTVLLVNVSIEVAVVIQILLTPLDHTGLVFNLVYVVLLKRLDVLFKTDFTLSQFS